MYPIVVVVNRKFAKLQKIYPGTISNFNFLVYLQFFKYHAY